MATGGKPGTVTLAVVGYLRARVAKPELRGRGRGPDRELTRRMFRRSAWHWAYLCGCEPCALVGGSVSPLNPGPACSSRAIFKSAGKKAKRLIHKKKNKSVLSDQARVPAKSSEEITGQLHAVG